MSLRAFEGQGGLFHISPQETEPKPVALKLKHRERGAEIKIIRYWLAQFRKWINRHRSVCEISTLNSTAVTSLRTSGTSTGPSNLWFKPDELQHAKTKLPTYSLSQLSGALISDWKVPIFFLFCSVLERHTSHLCFNTAGCFLYSIWQRPEWS